MIGDPDLLAAITTRGFVKSLRHRLLPGHHYVLGGAHHPHTKTRPVKHGWIAPLLGLVPGVAAGFAVYLLLRLNAGTDK